MRDAEDGPTPALRDEAPPSETGPANGPGFSPPLVQTTLATSGRDLVVGRVNPPPPFSVAAGADEEIVPVSLTTVAAAAVLPAVGVALTWLWPRPGAVAAALTAIVVGASVATMALEAREEARIVGPKAWIPMAAGAVAIVAAYLAAIDGVAGGSGWIQLGVFAVFLIQIGIALAATPERPVTALLTEPAATLDYRGFSDVEIDRETTWRLAKRNALIRGTFAGLASGLVIRSVLEAGDADGLAAGGMAALLVVSAQRLSQRASDAIPFARRLRPLWLCGLGSALLLSFTRLEWRSMFMTIPLALAAVAWTRFVTRPRPAPG